MGGENVVLRQLSGVTAGSSPRGRGKPPRQKPDSPPGRLIPAWAGKTCCWSCPLARSRAHPRVGGENGETGRRRGEVAGSSPRGRGKRVRPDRDARAARLIPAWAGKTRGVGFRRRSRPAHPRVGGENMNSSSSASVSCGSSPRGRGKLHGLREPLASPGLIPAWAGKTAYSATLRPRGKAHPRVGGENSRGELRRKFQPGSSPRGRGKPRLLDCFEHELGLIPAWAGKTPSTSCLIARAPAHPRVGGENS